MYHAQPLFATVLDVRLKPRRLSAWAEAAAACGGLKPLFVNPALLGRFFSSTTTTTLLSPVPASILNGLTTLPESEFEAVGKGSAQTQFLATPAHTALLTASGKPEIVYVGAEYCPYCGVQRWGMIIALSRFGSFSGLKLMTSDANDVYPNTPTFTFRSATYSSSYLALSATETEDRTGNKLDTPPPDIMNIFNTYDSSTYTQSPGSIPFLSYGNQYITIGSPFTPDMMQGQSWQQIVTQLQNPTSSVAQAIIGDANMETAALCKLTKNQPASACDAPIIQQLEAGLPVAK